MAETWKKIAFQEKQYLGGVDFELAGANLSVVRAVAIPYQTSDGAWRIKFNLALTISVAVDDYILSINGVVFKNDTNQACAGMTLDSPTTKWVYNAWAIDQTDNIRIAFSVTVDEFAISGDVELDSKPTWAD